MEERKLVEGIARQELHLIFVIDCSGSMEGANIGAVNSAIRDVMAIMPEIQEETSDAVIKISALTFNDKTEWVNKEPQAVEEFKWSDLTANGQTDFSLAYMELANFLRKRVNGGMMPDLGGIAPIILLMTDGVPTSQDWEEKLEELRKKGWFRAALKYALAIGAESDEAKEVLRKFTGNAETVLKVYSAESLRKVIKVIAVTASKVKSKSQGIKTATNLPHNAQAQAVIADQLEKVEEVEW